MDIIENLRVQGVRESLIKDILHFRKEYKVDNEVKHRVTKSPAFYIGEDILSMCISAILEEENICRIAFLRRGRRGVCRSRQKSGQNPG